MKDIKEMYPQDDTPIKKELLLMLQRIKEDQMIIMQKIEALEKEHSTKRTVIPTESPLRLFIHEDKQIEEFLYRLSSCRTSREWAQHAVYPLYEYGYITAEDLTSRHFIEMTIPYCTQLKKKNFECLKKQLYKHCYIPPRECK